MKTMLITLIAALSAVNLAGATGLPSGTFVGSGQWRGQDGSSGRYSVETTVSGDTMRSVYKWEHAGEATQSSTVKMSPRADGFFDLLDDTGQVVGNGFCFEAECSYRLDAHGVAIDESLQFDGRALHKLGSKKGTGFKVMWKEDLELR